MGHGLPAFHGECGLPFLELAMVIFPNEELSFGDRCEEAKMIIGDTDIELLLTFNSLLGSNELHNKRLWDFGNGSLFRGFLIFFSLLALWFSYVFIIRRSRMRAGLSVTCPWVLLSFWCQHCITPHIRPLLDPALHLNIADPEWATLFQRQGSFPSDTATLFFSLAAVIFLENRLVGCLCFLWTLV